MKISLCVFNLNEIKALKFIVPLIFKNLSNLNIDDIYVVDGGSTDGSLEYLKNFNLNIINQKNKGIGNAMIEGINKINGDYIIFFNPDGNEDVKDIGKFKKFFEQNYDIVIASRMLKESFNEEDVSILKLRKWTNQIFTLIVNLIYNRNKYVTDTINGFRGGNLNKLKALKLNTPGHAIEYQMSIRSFKKKYRIVEFPTYEYPRIGGHTTAPSFKTGIIFIKFLIYEIFFSKFK